MAVVVKMQDRPERRTVPVEGLDGCSLTVREPTNRERMEQWLYAASEVPAKADGSRESTAFEVALWEYRMRVVVDWGGFVGEDGQPLQFNPRTFDAAIRQEDALQTAAVKAANLAFRGLSEQDEKNSGQPSAVG